MDEIKKSMNLPIVNNPFLDMGMDTVQSDIWGSTFWKMLHYISFAYPTYPSDERIQQTKTFINSFCDILPCPKCRLHLKANLKKFPLTDEDLSTKIKLYIWIYKLHNIVNLELGYEEKDFSNSLIELLAPEHLLNTQKDKRNPNSNPEYEYKHPDKEFKKEFFFEMLKKKYNTDDKIIPIDKIYNKYNNIYLREKQKQKVYDELDEEKKTIYDNYKKKLEKIKESMMEPNVDIEIPEVTNPEYINYDKIINDICVKISMSDNIYVKNSLAQSLISLINI